MVNINLNLKKDINELVVTNEEIKTDLNSFKNNLFSFEDLEEIKDLRLEVGELEYETKNVSLEVERIKTSYDTYNRTKDVKLFTEMVIPSLEAVGYDTDELLVSLTNNTLAEESILGAIGKGIKAVFDFLINIVKTLITMVIKFISAIINFIAGFFKNNHIGSGGGSGKVRSKVIAKEAEVKVKKQFKEIREKIQVAQPSVTAADILKEVLNKNINIYVKKLLEHLGLEGIFSLLKNASSNSNETLYLINYNKVVISYLREMDSILSKIGTLVASGSNINMPLPTFVMGSGNLVDLPAVEYAFDGNFMFSMNTLTFFNVKVALNLMTTLKTKNEKEITDALFEIVTNSTELFGDIAKNLNGDNSTITITAGRYLVETGDVDRCSLNFYNKIIEFVLNNSDGLNNSLINTLKRLQTITNNHRGCIFLNKKTAIINDILELEDTEKLLNFTKNTMDFLADLPLFKANDNDRSIKDFDKLTDIELCTILEADRVKINDKMVPSNIVVNLRVLYKFFTGEDIVENSGKEKNNLNSLVDEFTTYLNKNSFEVDNKKNYGISTSIKLQDTKNKIPLTENDVKGILEMLEKANIYITANKKTSNNKINDLLSIELLNIIKNPLVSSVNKQVNKIKNDLKNKNETMDKLERTIKEFSTLNNDGISYKTKFKTLYAAIKKGLETHKSNGKGLSFGGINDSNISEYTEIVTKIEKDSKFNLSDAEINHTLGKYLKYAIIEEIAKLVLKLEQNNLKYSLKLLDLTGALMIKYKDFYNLIGDIEFIVSAFIIESLNNIITENVNNKETNIILEDLGKYEKVLLKKIKEQK